MLLFAIEQTTKGDNILLVSEETGTSNDNKIFKKLPAICKQLNLDIKTLPQLLEDLDGIDVQFR